MEKVKVFIVSWTDNFGYEFKEPYLIKSNAVSKKRKLVLEHRHRYILLDECFTADDITEFDDCY